MMWDSSPLRLSSCLLLVGLCFLASTQPSRAADYQDALREAERLRLKGDQEGIVLLLGPWAEKDPGLAEAQHRLGLAFYRQQNFPRAIEHLSAALRLEEEGSESWKETVEILALAYYFSERAHDALPLFEQVLTWNKTDPHLAYALATTYIYVRDTANAKETLAKLFGIPPGSPQAFLLAAHFMIRESFMEEGGMMIRRAQELAQAQKNGSRSLPEARYRLGLVALRSGNFDEAAQHFKQELAVNPSHSLAWHYLGDAYLRMNELEEAVMPLQRSIWLNHDATRSHVLIASVYFRQERFLLAENSLRRALDLSPDNYEAHFLLARVYFKTNRTEMARKRMDVAKELLATEHATTEYQGMGAPKGK